MVRLAIASDPYFAISDVEIRRPGKSYSIDTIRLLQQEYGAQTQLFFLIGLDAFLDFPSWREPLTLLELCPFVVLSRPGLSFRSLSTVTLLPPIPQSSLADLEAEFPIRGASESATSACSSSRPAQSPHRTFALESAEDSRWQICCRP
jgi:nicotinate-nucleotide adenylyltransferase